MNNVQISGWLARDPEVRYFESGSVVTSTAIGLQEYKKEGQNTTFAEVKAWGKTAEFMAQYLHKGDFVLASGRLETESWKTPEGQSRSKTVIVLERVETPPKPKTEGTPPGIAF